jgi:hypothetical protein
MVRYEVNNITLGSALVALPAAFISIEAYRPPSSIATATLNKPTRCTWPDRLAGEFFIIE